MQKEMEVGEFRIQVFSKDIKNVHLSVLPPDGRVRISTPKSMKTDAIRMYVISKVAWIRKEQEKLKKQARETLREFIDRESHYLWGKKYLLKITESEKPAIEVKHNELSMRVKPGTSRDESELLLDSFYREQLRSAIPAYIKKYERLINVKVEKIYVQKMKTKWGSCNHQGKNIRLNSELAKKPRHLTEYVVAHEMTHLIDPTHGSKFTTVMDKVMPAWRQFRNELNSLPLRYEPSHGTPETL